MPLIADAARPRLLSDANNGTSYRYWAHYRALTGD